MSRFWLALPVLLVASEARAYLCSRVVDGQRRDVGPSLSWFSREITYSLHTDGTVDLPDSNEQAILEASFRVWEDLTGCMGGQSDIRFVRGPDSNEDVLVGFNHLDPDENENLVVFRDEEWPLHDENANAIALTTTTYEAQGGEIYDADIEFNSAGSDFADADVACAGEFDLMNTAVHEIGHVLGLGHPDEVKTFYENSFDTPDPGCQTGATMCHTANHCETSKRTLDCDDRDGVVFKYPTGEANRYCSPPACVGGLPGCGNCSEVECQEWKDCGYCAPPEPLLRATMVTAVGFDDGLGGCNCAGGAVWWLATLPAFALRRWRTGSS